MRRWMCAVGAFMVVFCLSAAVPWEQLAAQQDESDYVPGQVIVKFKANSTTKEKLAFREDLGGRTLGVLPRSGAELLSVEGMTVEEAIERYRSHGNVEYIEANYRVKAIAIPNDPMFDKLWGLRNTGQTGGVPDADIDADEAWEISTGSRSVVVGIVDTGVDYRHPDLAANIWRNPGEIPGNGVDDDGNGFVDDYRGWDFHDNDNDPMDDHGHGTHCAGTIGAVGNDGIGVAGINWNVSICPLKFLSGSG